LWLHQFPRGEGASHSGERIGILMVELQGKYLLGASQLPGIKAEKNGGQGGEEKNEATHASKKPELYKQSRLLNDGPIGQRLRFIVLAGELAGPQEALRQLDMLDQKITANHIKP